MTAFLEFIELAVGAVVLPLLLWTVGAGFLFLVVTLAVSERFARIRSDLLVAAILALPLALAMPVTFQLQMPFVPPEAPPAPVSAAMPAPGPHAPDIGSAVVGGELPAEITEPTPSSAIGWGETLVLFWLLGMLIMFSRLIRGWVVIRGICSRAEPVHGIDVVGSVSVRRSSEVRIPFASGLIRPVVIVPGDGDSDAQTKSLDLVVKHELAHIKAGDVWALRLSLLIRAVFWPHPLLWLMMSRASTYRELACDAVATSGRSLEEYAVLLRSFASEKALIVPAMAGRSIHGRLEMLANEPDYRQLSRRVAFLLPVVAVVLVAMTGVRIGGERATDYLSVIFREDASMPQMQSALWGHGIASWQVDWGTLSPVAVEIELTEPPSAEQVSSLYGDDRVSSLRVLRRGTCSRVDRYQRHLSTEEFFLTVEFTSETLGLEARAIVEAVVGGDICAVRKFPNRVRVLGIGEEERDELIAKILADSLVISVDDQPSTNRAAVAPSSRSYRTVASIGVSLEIPSDWEVAGGWESAEEGVGYLLLLAPGGELSIRATTWERERMSEAAAKAWGRGDYHLFISNAKQVTPVADILSDPSAEKSGTVMVSQGSGTYYAAYASKGSMRFSVIVGGETNAFGKLRSAEQSRVVLDVNELKKLSNGRGENAYRLGTRARHRVTGRFLRPDR